jgi:23S rRNA pseudouridine955/2504/2580 synthase
MEWTVDEEISLLNFLKKVAQNGCSVKQIKRSIDNRGAIVNHRIERFASRRLKSGDLVEFHFVTTQKIDILKLFEDEHLLVIDKPSGLVCEEKQIRKELGTVWLVHRLDKETSGVMMLAKTPQAKQRLDAMFAKRETKKLYLAIVHGAMLRDEGVVDTLVNGKSASTSWKCLKKPVGFSLLECSPHTGRTHQIRIHMRQIGHPVVGDLLYGQRKNEKGVKRLLLHAHRLGFKHPITDEELNFETPMPIDFLDASFC